MLTQEQIRTLNDARTILKDLNPPHTWEGGRVGECYSRAEQAIFHALNVTCAYLGEPVSKEQLHNKEPDRARYIGRADVVSVVGDEEGWELHISTDDGNYVVNVHGISPQLIAIGKEIGEYWEEGGRAAAEHQRDLDRADAYDLRNPKHPNWHSVHADLYPKEA